MMRSGVSFLILVGCTNGAVEPELDTTASALTAVNGQNLNGQNLNGQNLNGQNLNGQNLNGPDTGTFTIWTSLENVKLNGKTISVVELSATVFKGYDGSAVRSGTDFAQAEFQARRGDGSDVRMRLRSIVPGDIYRYFVEYRETDGNWYPVCEDASGPAAAIPVNGTWDHRQGVSGGGSHTDDPLRFTFACASSGAIGKCVGLGYEPWSSIGSVNLAAHHEACVRLLRADYCGDGTPYTQDGNLVNLFDDLGIQADTEDWVIEAEWDRDGARCFYPLNRSRNAIPCYDARVELGCGAPANFDRGALLMNETPTAGLTQ